MFPQHRTGVTASVHLWGWVVSTLSLISSLPMTPSPSHERNEIVTLLPLGRDRPAGASRWPPVPCGRGGGRAVVLPGSPQPNTLLTLTADPRGKGRGGTQVWVTGPRGRRHLVPLVLGSTVSRWNYEGKWSTTCNFSSSQLSKWLLAWEEDGG